VPEIPRARTVDRVNQTRIAQGRDKRGEMNQVYAGIDVSKEFLDVAVLPSDERKRYSNDEAGIGELTARLKKLSSALVVMEPTGGLEMPLAAALTLEGVKTAVVNARQVRDYARATGKLAKTDKIDALVMAEFASAIKPPIREFRDEATAEIKSIMSRRRQLLEMLTAEKNRLAIAHKSLKPKILSHIEWLKKEIADLDGQG
jgi:transposase